MLPADGIEDARGQSRLFLALLAAMAKEEWGHDFRLGRQKRQAVTPAVLTKRTKGAFVRAAGRLGTRQLINFATKQLMQFLASTRDEILFVLGCRDHVQRLCE